MKKKLDIKLALNEKFDTNMIKVAQDALLETGKISEAYLMRKLKITFSAACELKRKVMNITSDN